MPVASISFVPPQLSTMRTTAGLRFLYSYMENQGEIILYQPDNEVKLEVQFPLFRLLFANTCKRQAVFFSRLVKKYVYDITVNKTRLSVTSDITDWIPGNGETGESVNAY